MRRVNPQAVQKQPFPGPDVVTKPIPSPTDGWDQISPLALMDPKRAPILINWVPHPGWVEARAGYNIWVTLGATYLTGQPVETLMVYRALGSETLFAASNGIIYDVSSQYSPTVATLDVSSGQPFTSNRWNYVSFTPANAPTVIQLANGVDNLHQFNGTTWSAPSITGLPFAGGTAQIRSIATQKRRIWYVLNNGSAPSTVAAYMPTDAITGPIAGTLDLGALWTKGGSLQTIANWTIDGGAGPNDYVAFISSKGQVSLYQGTDPTSANTWSIVGTFDLPRPISDRCATRLGSDVAIITMQGVLPLSTVLPFDPSADRSVAITARIQNAMGDAANFYNANFGWQLISFPFQQLIILNIPVTENSQQVQFVMHALAGGWCQFQGWNFNCYEIFNDNLYAGDNLGNVTQCYVGSSDLISSINCDMQCAFNYFDDPGRIKRVTMIQPLITSDGTITPSIGVDTDYGTSTATAPIITLLPTTSGNQSLWDSAIWDKSLWGGGTQVVNTWLNPGGLIQNNAWLSSNAIGHALAVRLKLNFTGITNTSGVFDVGKFDSAQFDGGLSTAGPILRVNAFNAIMELGGFLVFSGLLCGSVYWLWNLIGA